MANDQRAGNGTMNNGRDCKHGQLARSCGTCEMEAEVHRLREALMDIEETAGRSNKNVASIDVQVIAQRAREALDG